MLSSHRDRLIQSIQVLCTMHYIYIYIERERERCVFQGLATLPGFINLYPVYLRRDEYDHLAGLRRRAGNAPKTLSTKIPVVSDTPSTSPSPVPVCSSIYTLDRRRDSNSGLNSASSSAASAKNPSPVTPRRSRHPASPLSTRKNPRTSSPSPRSQRRDPIESTSSLVANGNAHPVADQVGRQPKNEIIERSTVRVKEDVTINEGEGSDLKVPKPTSNRLSPIGPTSLPSSLYGSFDAQAAATQGETLPRSENPSRAQSVESSESVYLDCKAVVDSSASPSPFESNRSNRSPSGVQTDARHRSWVSDEVSTEVVLVDDDEEEETGQRPVKRSRSGAISLVEEVDAAVDRGVKTAAEVKQPPPPPPPPPPPDNKVRH